MSEWIDVPEWRAMLRRVGAFATGLLQIWLATMLLLALVAQLGLAYPEAAGLVKWVELAILALFVIYGLCWQWRARP